MTATHLRATSDDKTTLCGLAARDNADLPYMLARFVDRRRVGHVRAGRPFALCRKCEAAAIAQEVAFTETDNAS